MALIACYLTQDRLTKTAMILGAFARGCGGTIVEDERPREDADLHVCWGQRFGPAESVLPWAAMHGSPTAQIDNGWWFPAGGRPEGYYRITFDGPAPRWLPGADPDRPRHIGVPEPRPWRQAPGGHVLLALGGEWFGRPYGINVADWNAQAEGWVRAATDRRVLVRSKADRARPLADDLAGAWCVVTHSSGVAVEAAMAGVPVVCAPQSPTAPLGNAVPDWTDAAALAQVLELPALAGDETRRRWVASLASQQFTLPEFRSGEAWRRLRELGAAPDLQGVPQNPGLIEDCIRGYLREARSRTRMARLRSLLASSRARAP